MIYIKTSVCVPYPYCKVINQTYAIGWGIMTMFYTGVWCFKRASELDRYTRCPSEQRLGKSLAADRQHAGTAKP